MKKATMEQLGRFAVLVEKGLIEFEELENIIKNQGASTLSRMLEACRQDYVDPDINEENFSIGEPADDTEYELVHLNKKASTEEAETEVKSRGLELCDTTEEFLDYIRKNRGKQKKFPVVGLGIKRKINGHWVSPYAYGWYGGRWLVLRDRERGWHEHCRFLARKPR